MVSNNWQQLACHLHSQVEQKRPGQDRCCSYLVPLAHTNGRPYIVPSSYMHAVSQSSLSGSHVTFPLFSDLTCKAPCLRLRLTHNTSSCSCACCTIQVH